MVLPIIDTKLLEFVRKLIPTKLYVFTKEIKLLRIIYVVAHGSVDKYY